MPFLKQVNVVMHTLRSGVIKNCNANIQQSHHYLMILNGGGEKKKSMKFNERNKNLSQKKLLNSHDNTFISLFRQKKKQKPTEINLCSVSVQSEACRIEHVRL